MSRPFIAAALFSLLLAGCSSPGAYLKAVDGPAFAKVAPSDAEHALVYIYRPRSTWDDQELEAPGLFLNNQLIGSLPSNGYLTLELDVADYKLEMRRPLLGSFWTLLADGPFDFNRIASFTLDAESGAQYFLRYDELNPPPAVSTGKQQGDGPLQVVDEALALKELAVTRQVQGNEQVAKSGELVRPQRGFWRKVGESLEFIGI